MNRLFSAIVLSTFALTVGLSARAQQEGPVATQALVNVDAKSTPPPSAADVAVSVNDHKEPVTAWAPVVPANAQVALLIDDGLRESVGRELENLRKFLGSVPPGVELMIGYMKFGSVEVEQPFTTDHAAVAAKVRLPGGIPGMSASPYLCLSDFVKKWPGSAASSYGSGLGAPTRHKARFVLM